MKKILLFVALLLNVIQIHCVHSHDQIMQQVIEQSQKFLFDNDGSTVLLKPSYGLKKPGYRSFELEDIVTPGFYQLAGPITRKLTIASDNVTLDLGGQNLSSGLVIAANTQNVTIKNGTVDIGGSAGDAIKVNAGCSGITLCDVAVRNALNSGICFDTVRDSVIKNCDLSSNTTGLALETCANIIVDSCNAVCNTVTGFGMVSSTTCSFIGCSALSTGEANVQPTNQEVFGFVSANGSGNIFERCIANSTQALSTTDFDSVVSGFALRGNEGCTKIIECEASNATTSSDGVTVPYGIFLEGTFEQLISLTAINPGDGSDGDVVRFINWSPDGKYLAVGGDMQPGEGKNLIIYEFDPIQPGLQEVVSLSPNNDQVDGVHWSPDGLYLAVVIVPTPSTDDATYVYRFDRTNNTLTLVDSANQGAIGAYSTAGPIIAVRWSPNGNFLAVAASHSSSADDVYVYSFDRVSETLTFVDSALDASSQVDSIKWRPDGRFLAVSGLIGYFLADDIVIFEFSNDVLTERARGGVGSGNDILWSCDWSFDGQYLVAGGRALYSPTDKIGVFTFDDESYAFNEVASFETSENTDEPVSLSWSPNGTYLAAGTRFSNHDALVIFEFNRGTNELTQLDAVNPYGGSGIDVVRTTDWYPSGEYIAIGGDLVGTNTTSDLIVYSALAFPSKNVIKDNTVYCNSGARFPSGVGISGSSISNLIIGNTSYNNPNNPYVVFENYIFVTNVFNPLFQPAPSILQNLSFGGCVPIATPADVPLLWQRALDKTSDIQTKVDLLGTLIP